MPETAIDEDGDFPINESNIRFSDDGTGVFCPSFNTHAHQHRPQASFEFRGFPFNRPHCFLAVFRA